jgi:hypothetical protein
VDCKTADNKFTVEDNRWDALEDDGIGDGEKLKLALHKNWFDRRLDPAKLS